jgi:dTMP kinase
MFVTIEGIEGSGKSTLQAGLANHLNAIGREAVVTREPGGTPVGDAIRELFLHRGFAMGALTETLLVNAARAQHVVDVIGPALAAGRTVLCDRFVDSTIAYQGYGRGLDVQLLELLCTSATGGLKPDVTFLLDVPVELSRRRMQAKRPDRLEAEDDAFHERVRRGFLEIAASSARYRVLDGALGAQELLFRAWSVLIELLHVSA